MDHEKFFPVQFSIFYLTRATTVDDDVRAEWILRTAQFVTGPIVISMIFVQQPYHVAVVVVYKLRRMSCTNALALPTTTQPNVFTLPVRNPDRINHRC
ncbi:hypothetical protein RB195_026445 [Necator americanus]|uniref:Uncharacterized protein n=1 Tax=Necator americanus TaxID=51031 RepID=A0ABR1EX31_NECAM